jgi:PadR family transcriptional regulator PadR
MTPRRAASSERLELLQGTLDMLVLRTLRFGPGHGHSIATFIAQTTDDVLKVEHGSLYPALHRLVKQRLITARWETPKGVTRQLKIYRLTPKGRARLAAEASKWERLSNAIGRIMQPAREG